MWEKATYCLMKTGEVVRLKNHKYEIEIEKVDVEYLLSRLS